MEVVVLNKGSVLLDIMKHDALDRAQWRKQIHIADCNPSRLRCKARFGLVG